MDFEDLCSCDVVGLEYKPENQSQVYTNVSCNKIMKDETSLARQSPFLQTNKREA